MTNLRDKARNAIFALRKSMFHGKLKINLAIRLFDQPKKYQTFDDKNKLLYKTFRKNVDIFRGRRTDCCLVNTTKDRYKNGNNKGKVQPITKESIRSANENDHPETRRC